MNREEEVCICHRVSLGKLTNYIKREEPKVASQLSECLGAGTACRRCQPFLEKILTQHQAGELMELKVGFENYADKRQQYKSRNCTHEEGDG